MNIVVTGAAGEVGKHLVELLDGDSRFRKVLAIDVAEPTVSFKKVEFIKADIRHPRIPEIIKENKIDCMVHLARMKNPRHNASYAHEVDVIGTIRMFSACQAGNVKKIIIPSPTFVYGASATNPNFIPEDFPLKAPRGFPFMADKVEVEKLARQFKAKNPQITVTILRHAPVLGVNYNSYFVNMFRRPYIITNLGFDPMMQFLHEQDMIEALMLAVESDHSGAFNIVGDGAVPLSKAIRMNGQVAIPIPSPLSNMVLDTLWMLRISDFPGAFMNYLKYVCCADPTKAKEVLKFQARFSSEEALADFVENSRVSRYIEKKDEELIVPDVSTQEPIYKYIEERIQSAMKEKTGDLDEDDEEGFWGA